MQISPSEARQAATRSLGGLAVANLLAQLAPIAAAPLLTRLYQPSDFGQFGLFATIAGGVAACSTLKFEWMVPHARSHVRAIALTRLAILATSITALATGLAATLMSVIAPSTTPIDRTLCILLTPAVLATGASIAISGWWIRVGSLQVMGRVRVVQAGLVTLLALLGGLYVESIPHGLEWSFVIGGAAACLVSALHLRFSAIPSTALQRATIVGVLRRTWSMAAWSTSIAAVNTLSGSALIVVTSLLFSAQEVGWVVLAQRVVLSPLSLLTGPVASAFWANAASLSREGNYPGLSGLYKRTTLKLLAVALIPAACCVSAPWVVGPIFGRTQWAEAGAVCQALVPIVIGNVGFSLTNHLVVLNLQRWQLLSDGVRVSLSLVAIVIAHHAEMGIVTVVWLLSFASLIGNVVLFLTHLIAHGYTRGQHRVLGN